MNNIGKTIQELRKDKGITQKQLADATGLSLSAIKNYENSNREPNSKAMVALEKFFNVSGEFLRGNLDKNTFIKNSEIINNDLDNIIDLFLIFKTNFSIMPQNKQLIASKILIDSLTNINDYMINRENLDFINLNDFFQLLRSFSSLNSTGQQELLKRAQELTLLSQYKQ